MVRYPRMVLVLERILRVAVKALLVLTVAFLLAPLVLTVVMSLDSRPFMGYFPPPGLTTKWLVGFFDLPEYTKGARVTLILAAIAMVSSTLVGLLAALALVRYEIPGRVVLTNFFMGPLIVPGVVVGYGMLGMFAMVGGLGTLQRLILAHVVITLPYTMRIIMATLSGVDRSFEEAAMSLGANPFRAFWNVTLPLIKPGVFGAALMAFAVSIGDVPVSVFLIDPTTSTLSIAMFSQLQSYMTPSIAVASTYLMSVTLVAMWAVDRALGLARFVGLRTAVG